MKLSESKTFYNLTKAYAGECMARTRYEFIEYGARNEGYKTLAEVIDKIVYNEFNHARMFYTKIQDASDKPIKNVEICGDFPFKEKWDLVENLKFGAEDEQAEAELYPEFAKTAAEEGFTEIAELFENVAEIENCHKKLFTDLYNQLKSGSLYKKEKPVKWKCSGCGYEQTSAEAWKVCPVCNAKQGEVMLKLENR